MTAAGDSEDSTCDQTETEILHATGHRPLTGEEVLVESMNPMFRMKAVQGGSGA